jgi:hypothetical protein
LGYDELMETPEVPGREFCDGEIDVTGTVAWVGTAPRRFGLKIPSVPKVLDAMYLPAEERTVISALADRETMAIRVRGRGLFQDGQLISISEVESLTLVSQPELDRVEADRTHKKPVWERIREIMADVPEEEWATLPSSDDIDLVVYGRHSAK